MSAKLSKRAERALEVLRAGGFFRNALETAYRGEKFRTRLYPAGAVPWRHKAIPGIGAAALRELEAAGLVRRRPCAQGSTWPTEWEIAEPACACVAAVAS